MEIVPTKYRGSREYLIVYTELINAARYRGTITYQHIARIMGLQPSGRHMGREVGHLIGEISEDEVKRGRPMLSALTVNVNGKPGPGLFTLARELGRSVAEGKAEHAAFWERECQELYAIWETPLKREQKET